MPNKKAKANKRAKRLLNIKLKSQGRTANQVKRRKNKEAQQKPRLYV
tara:strand:- start:3471 stop:3611 length:141 start_codon:yes stop_codon:yes gene_type:complete